MRIGFGCLVLAFPTGWALNVSFPFRDGHIDVGVNSAGGTSLFLVYGAVVVGFVLILTGLIWEVIRYRTEQRRLSRKSRTAPPKQPVGQGFYKMLKQCPVG